MLHVFVPRLFGTGTRQRERSGGGSEERERGPSDGDEGSSYPCRLRCALSGRDHGEVDAGPPAERLPGESLPT